MVEDRLVVECVVGRVDGSMVVVRLVGNGKVQLAGIIPFPSIKQFMSIVDVLTKINKFIIINQTFNYFFSLNLNKKQLTARRRFRA